MATQIRTLSASIVQRAALESFLKLDPRVQWRNPVMFVVWAGSVLVTLIWFVGTGKESSGFVLAVALWLWFTIVFANFAESVAEGRGKAQAAALRGTRRDVMAKKLSDPAKKQSWRNVPGSALRKGDFVYVPAGEVIPGDGEVVEGAATVDESAITGESAPVVRESGGDRSAVTGGTRVLSDWLVVRITANPGETFLDRMIVLVEGARRSRTPNEIALSILLAKFTLIFLFACATLLPFSVFSVKAAAQGAAVSITVLVALLVCLIPTTIGGLLSAIGIAGMDRMIKANIIATSGRAVEAAGDVDVLLLDKTGTITLGNRQAAAFAPVLGVTSEALADAAQLASLADETPEGRSIVVFAKQRHGLRERDLKSLGAQFIPFSANTRMSGVDIGERRVRKGAADALRAGGEAQADPRAPGAGPPHRHVRRRHQRRAGARAGRCRGGDELGHAGGERSRQHGRPRLEPDQAHRGGRDRQAAPHHARFAHHLLDRERRRQVLRHHPGRLCDDLSAAQYAERDAPRDAVVGHPFGGDLQRAHPHPAHPARA